jgi:hypothetical protein
MKDLNSLFQRLYVFSYIVFFAFVCFNTANSQVPNGPGGVGNTVGTSTLRMWWRPELGITLTAGQVSAWADQSGYGNNLTGPAGFRTTTVTSAAMNNQTVMNFAGAQYFSSGFSGPNVNDMTIFMAANGTSYQSLFRFQNVAGTFVVYPWEFGGGRTFISSSDGGTGAGIASGLVNSVNNVAGARYRRNTANGMQTYLNGGINAQRNSVNAALPNQPFFAGRYNPGASEYPNARVGDMIIYYSAINDAQTIIVQNYLAAKYNVALSSNDVYTMDNAGNGNFDFDVAGIGRVNATNIHNDAQGTGIVRILNPAGLGDNEFYMWGHDNGVLGAYTTADYPAGEGLQGRLVRVWRGSETGTINSFDVRFDLTGLGPVVPATLRLLIDTDNDGVFADETVAGGGVVGGASLIAGNVYGFAAVTGLNNNLRFTLGSLDISSTPLPVELLDFSGVLNNNNNKVELSWSTATEKNSDYFNVERSIDAQEFIKVGMQKAAGNSNKILKYSNIDENPINGISYYRLKQFDVDGSFHFSNIISINVIKEKNVKFIVYPNPNKGEFTADISGIENNHEVQISLKNEKGVTVYDSKFFIQDDNSNKLNIVPESKLSNGLYICTLTLEGIEYHVKLIVN